MRRPGTFFFFLIALAGIFSTPFLKAQMVGNDAYIKATSIEIGISGQGGFEGVDTTVSPLISGLHFRSNQGYFGFVANPQLNNWATFDGDFFTPGNPENGWGFEIGSTDTLQFGNNCSGYQIDIPGAITSWKYENGCYSVDWEGDKKNLHFKINYSLHEDDLYYTTSVTVTNNTGAVIPDFYYYRNVDPDNNITINDSYSTVNTIESQPTGTCGIAHVSATQSTPNNSYLGLAALGTNWRASYDGYSLRDGSDIWNGIGLTQTVNSSSDQDVNISLAYRIQNFAAGASETFKFVVILASSQAGNAINNLLYLDYPNASTSGSSSTMCAPKIDTVRVCEGTAAPIAVKGPIIDKYSWSWSPAVGLSTDSGPSTVATPSVTTSYTLTGTPQNSCVSKVVMDLVVLLKPAASLNPIGDVTACLGETVPASAFTSIYPTTTYAWTNSNTNIGLAASGTGNVPSFIADNPTASALTSTITVTPSASDLCDGTPETYQITIYPNTSLTVNSPTICAGEVALLSASGALNYTWSAGATDTGNGTAEASPTTSTSYTVTGTGDGCASEGVVNVSVKTSPVTNPINSISLCNGENVLENIFSSTPAGSTFEWTNSDASIGLASSGTGTVPAFSSVNLSSNTITSTITATPTLNGCVGDSAQYTISIYPSPNSPTVSDVSVCSNTQATLTATAPGGSYTWYNDAAGTNLIGTGNSYTTPALMASTNYYIKTTNTEGCESALSTATVNIAPELSISAGDDDSICFNGSILLNPIPDDIQSYSYSWSPSNSLSDVNIARPTANPTTTTSYTLTVTSSDGCVGSDEITIYVDTEINISKTTSNVSCANLCDGSISAIANGGSGVYTYLWSNDETSAQINDLCPNSYSLVVSDSWQCSAATDTSIIEPNALTATLTTKTATSCNAYCDATASISAIGGTPSYTYSWSTSPIQTTSSANNLCAGNYTFTVTDANNCTASGNVTITEPSLVTVNVSTASDTICYGASTQLTATASEGNGAPYSYQWINDNSLSSTNSSNTTANPLTTNTYTLNVSDKNGCAALPHTTTLFVKEPLQVSAGSSAFICLGDSSLITAIASKGNGKNYTYSWSPSEGVNNTAINNPIASPTSTKNYTVTVNDGCSLPATDTVSVIILPLPKPNFTADITEGCAPLCVNINDETTIESGTIAAFNWSFGDGSTSTEANNKHCYSNTGSYAVEFTATSNAGCTTTITKENFITVYTKPVAAASAPTTISIDEPEVRFMDQSINAAAWKWHFYNDYTNRSDSISYQQNPNYIYNEPGTYTVNLFVSSKNGCTDETTLTILVEPAYTLFIPNAFSPNNDNLNDYFTVEADLFIEFEMSIFNRWGDLVFYTNDINQKWDGSDDKGNEIAQQAVYIYIVNITDINKKKHNYVGSVTLIK